MCVFVVRTTHLASPVSAGRATCLFPIRLRDFSAKKITFSTGGRRLDFRAMRRCPRDSGRPRRSARQMWYSSTSPPTTRTIRSNDDGGDRTNLPITANAQHQRGARAVRCMLLLDRALACRRCFVPLHRLHWLRRCRYGGQGTAEIMVFEVRVRTKKKRRHRQGSPRCARWS